MAKAEAAVFFYGTLVVPAILVRVLGRNCSDLVFQDALLPVRHMLELCGAGKPDTAGKRL